MGSVRVLLFPSRAAQRNVKVVEKEITIFCNERKSLAKGFLKRVKLKSWHRQSRIIPAVNVL